MILPRVIHPQCTVCFRAMIHDVAPRVGQQIRALLDGMTCNYSELNDAWFRSEFARGTTALFAQPAELRYEPLTFLPHVKALIEPDDGGSKLQITHQSCFVEARQLAVNHVPWIAPVVRTWGPLGEDCDSSAVSDGVVALFIEAAVVDWFAQPIRPRPPGYDPMHPEQRESGLTL